MSPHLRPGCFPESQDPEKRFKSYINSSPAAPSWRACVAIYGYFHESTSPPIATVCMAGAAASMGALLSPRAGQKGALRPAQQPGDESTSPLGDFQGQATDIDIHAREILRMRARPTAAAGEAYLSLIEKTSERIINLRPPKWAQAYGLVDKKFSPPAVTSLRRKVRNREEMPNTTPLNASRCSSSAKLKRRRTSFVRAGRRAHL